MGRLKVWHTWCSSSKVQDLCEWHPQGLNEHKECWFQIKLYLVQGIVGGDAKDYGDIQFGQEGLAVVYRVDTHSGVWVIILSYISYM